MNDRREFMYEQVFKWLNPRPAGGGGAFERPPPQVFRG